MIVFDTHAHYDDVCFDADRDDLLASMPDNGVGLILNPGCDLESSRKAVQYANQYPWVYAAVGYHPENIEDLSDEVLSEHLHELEALAVDPRVKAIGEIGLDYYWCKDSGARKRQQEVFRMQMRMAKRLGLPVIVHDREAHLDSLTIVGAVSRGTLCIPLLFRLGRVCKAAVIMRVYDVLYWGHYL